MRHEPLELIFGKAFSEGVTSPLPSFINNISVIRGFITDGNIFFPGLIKPTNVCLFHTIMPEDHFLLLPMYFYFVAWKLIQHP